MVLWATVPVARPQSTKIVPNVGALAALCRERRGVGRSDPPAWGLGSEGSANPRLGQTVRTSGVARLSRVAPHVPSALEEEPGQEFEDMGRGQPNGPLLAPLAPFRLDRVPSERPLVRKGVGSAVPPSDKFQAMTVGADIAAFNPGDRVQLEAAPGDQCVFEDHPP